MFCFIALLPISQVFIKFQIEVWYAYFAEVFIKFEIEVWYHAYFTEKAKQMWFWACGAHSLYYENILSF